MTGNDPLSRIVYISVPENLTRSIGGFDIDASVPMPVELPAGATRFEPALLTWEAIVAGMLKILGYDENNLKADYYRRFVKAVKPNIFTELTETGILKAKNRQFSAADEIFTVLDGLFPDNGLVMLNRALVYEAWATASGEAGREAEADTLNDRAFEEYKRAVGCANPEPAAFLNSGFFYLKLNNIEKAQSAFRRYLDVGTETEKLEHVKQALKEIESRNLLDTLFKEAFDFIKMGREEEGIERIGQFLKTNPGVWNAWFLLGWALRRLERYAEGRDAFLKAIELGSEEVDTYNELSICLMELGDLSGSRTWLERALRKEPENVKIISNLGLTAVKQGKNDEARGFFETVLELDGEDEVAKKYLGFLRSSQ
jgi:tetratricopeptide (TPR) repeat protein